MNSQQKKAPVISKNPSDSHESIAFLRALLNDEKPESDLCIATRG
jgi:hypothetical protein